MVHALQESWRVLETGGMMIDLRPVHSNPAIEVLTSPESTIAGKINDAGGAVDDDAADEAVAEMVRRGYFSNIGRSAFKFSNYWETLDDLLVYAHEKWRNCAYIPPAVVEKGRKIIAEVDGPYQIRVCRKVTMGVYRKMA